MNTLGISVVIPTFNRPAQTAKAVESVLKQTLLPDEIIVVDDGSTDDTPDALGRFGNSIRLARQENRGVSAARNAGIRAGGGEWLAFLDSDDLWLPGKLEAQAAAIEDPSNSDHKVIYTNERWIKNGRQKNQGKRHRKHSGRIYEKCLSLCIISPSSVMVHRSVFKTVGFFDEDLPACEDYDMWLRVCARYPVLCVPEKLIVKQAGDWDQLSAQHGLDRYRIIALRKILDEGILSAEQKGATVNALREKARVYALGCRKHGRNEEAYWAEGIDMNSPAR